MHHLPRPAKRASFFHPPAFTLVMFAGLVGMLGFATLMGLSLVQERHNRIDHARIETENMTRLLEGQALATLQKVELVMKNVQGHLQSTDMRISKGSRTRHTVLLNQLLKEQLMGLPEAKLIQVANAAGDFIYSSIDPVPAINISDRAYFQTQRDERSAGLVISSPLVSRTLGSAAIIVSHRLNFPDGSFAGIVTVLIELSSFEKVYASLDPGPHGVIAMRDADLRLLARYPRFDSNMGQLMPDHPIARLFAQGVHQGFYIEKSPVDGIKRLYSYHRVGDYPLVVLAAVAEQDYLADWHRHLFWYGVAGLIIALTSLVLVWVARLALFKQSQAEEELWYLAFHDQLTQLPNRRFLQDRLQHVLTDSVSRGHGALLLIDLDNFKILNDTRGHDIGDRLLQQVAQRLTDCVREGGSVARFGGDEFLMLLLDLSENFQEAIFQVRSMGEKILEVLKQPYQLDDYEYLGTSSIGLTLFDAQRENMGELLKQADVALYQAKAAGRNTLRFFEHDKQTQVANHITEELLKQADLAMYHAKAAGRNTLRFFDPGMQITIAARAALEAELRTALAAHQFDLYYQVQVDSDGIPIGVEALLRWRHPARGLVSPAEFIPLAEDTGLILPIGHWVLETACAQLVSWATRVETAHLSMSVNVSAIEFHQPTFVKQVLSVLERTGANPQKLKLELTESVLLVDVEDVISKMTILKAHGVTFSLDDFGTGYSSLSYLKRLPLEQLKIDQSFVRNVLTDANDAAIARTIIALAHAMGLAVIAEGVETEAQRDFLADKGCRIYQGYLFSPPIPIADFCVETGSRGSVES